MERPEQPPVQEQAPTEALAEGGPIELSAEGEALELREPDQGQLRRVGELESEDAEAAEGMAETGASRDEVEQEVTRRSFINRMALGLAGGAIAGKVVEGEVEAQTFGYERSYGAEIARDFAYLGGAVAIGYFQKQAYEAYLKEANIQRKAEMAAQNVTQLKQELTATVHRFGTLEADLKHQERVLRQKGEHHLRLAVNSAKYHEKMLERRDLDAAIQMSRIGQQDPAVGMMEAKIRELDAEMDALFSECAKICTDHGINERQPGKETVLYMQLVGQLAPLHLRIGYLHRALGQWELEVQKLGVELEKSRDEREKKEGRAKIASILGVIGSIALSLAVRRPSYYYY